jgi:hypothetical protein
MELHGPRLELSVAQQVGLILAQVGLIEPVWRTVEMLREPLDGLDVVLDGGRGVVARPAGRENPSGTSARCSRRPLPRPERRAPRDSRHTPLETQASLA